MLLQLDIRNYAIIDTVTVQFSGNLNVITGETGAGKSILLGALSLILGVRADTGNLRNKEEKAIIEGAFQLPENPEIAAFFATHELDYAARTLLRREIIPSGKSRSFINDTPVNLQQLSQFSSLLVDLHQQFDTLQLGQAPFQLQVLDALAGHKSLLQSYTRQYQQYQQQCHAYTALTEQARALAKERDYDTFLLEELNEAGLAENELEACNEELQRLTHTEDLKRGLSAAVQLLQAEDQGAAATVRQAQHMLEPLSGLHKTLPGLLERLHSVHIELEDMRAELEQLDDAVEYDEPRIAFLQERINTGYKLLKKHGFQTTDQLLSLQRELQDKLQAAENMETAVLAAQKELQAQERQTRQMAEQLSVGRKKQVQPFVKQLQGLLQRVGMPNARLRVELSPGDLGETGADQVAFVFDANKSGHFLPLGKVASGGERSRLMLCIKSLIAHTGDLPTLIFDEIESGISGEAARQVSLLLSELAAVHQVICISHQPQIAGKADTHFQVFKAMEKGQVRTGIKQLSQKERLHVIAGMLSGDPPTPAAMANARELMER